MRVKGSEAVDRSIGHWMFMSSEVALPRAENICSSFRHGRQYTLYRLFLTINHIKMKDYIKCTKYMLKGFIFNQLHLDLDSKSTRKQPSEPEDMMLMLLPLSSTISGAEQTVAVTRCCPQVSFSLGADPSLMLSGCEPLMFRCRADLSWPRALTILLCDVSSQDAPLFPSQEVERAWHGMDVTLPRISHNLITVRL